MSMKDFKDWVSEEGVIVTAVSLGGVCSAAAAKAGVFYLGRFFTPTQFGIGSLPLLGVIGAVQGLAPWFVLQPMQDFLFRGVKINQSDQKQVFHVTLFLSHQAVTLGLVALTAVAAKAGLIASGMTLFGGAALCAASYAVNYGIDLLLVE